MKHRIFKELMNLFIDNIHLTKTFGFLFSKLNLVSDTHNIMFIGLLCFENLISSSHAIELIVGDLSKKEIHNNIVVQGDTKRCDFTEDIFEYIDGQIKLFYKTDKYLDDLEGNQNSCLHLFKIDRYEDFIVKFKVFDEYLLDRNSKEKPLYVADLMNKNEITIFSNICQGKIHDASISISPPIFFRILNFISYLIPEPKIYSLNIYNTLINIGLLGSYSDDIIFYCQNHKVSIDKRHFIMFLSCFFSPINLYIENDAIIFTNRELSPLIYDFSTCFSDNIISFRTTCSIYYYLMNKLNETRILAFFWCLKNLNITKIEFIGLKTYVLNYCYIPQTKEDGLEERILVRKYEMMSLNLASYFISDAFNKNIIEIYYADRLDVCDNSNFLYKFKNLETLHIESIHRIFKWVNFIDASYFFLQMQFLLLKNLILTTKCLQEIFKMRIAELIIKKCEIVGEITNDIFTGQEHGFYSIRKIIFKEKNNRSSIIGIFTKIKYLTEFHYKSTNRICLQYSKLQNNYGIFYSLKVLHLSCSSVCECLYSFLGKIISLEVLHFKLYIRNTFDLKNLFKIRNIRSSLKVLKISNANLTEYSISKISKFIKLQKLYLNFCSVTIVAFPIKFLFGNLKALYEVNFEGTDISSTGIRFLKKCQNVESLILTKCNLSDYLVEKIRNYSKKCLKSLKKLHLFGNKISSDMILFILNLPALENLEISVDRKSFSNLLQRTEINFSSSINYLGISRAYITKFHLRTLIRRSNITKILFLGCKFADDSAILLRKHDVDIIEIFQVEKCNISAKTNNDFVLLFKNDVYRKIN